jgi:hypothetical protein
MVYMLCASSHDESELLTCISYQDAIMLRACIHELYHMLVYLQRTPNVARTYIFHHVGTPRRSTQPTQCRTRKRGAYNEHSTDR